MKEKKKIFLVMVLLIIIFSLIVGISYAYWASISSQESSNVIESSCLKLEINDKTSAINLSSAYPMSESEASKLIPYEFEVRNTCNTDAEFAINLDILDVEERLNSNYVAISFNNGEKEILGSKTKVEPIYKGEDYTAIEGYNLGNDELKVGEAKTYTIKLWLDGNIETIDSMNKQFLSKISLSSETNCTLLTDYILELAKDSGEIVEDETNDHNLRYIGVDPNNYVSFNNELWRIIGVMNDVEDENGIKEPRVKLIRNESIGAYSVDNKPISTNVWSDTTMMEVLNNGAYYNRTNGNCPYGTNGNTKACDFSDSGLTSEAKNMISIVKWKQGGTDAFDKSNAIMFYTNERNNALKEWIGQVGLMYTSDYGYATSGGSTVDRNTCLARNLYAWDTSELSDCFNNNWLYGSSVDWKFTLSRYLNVKNYLYIIKLQGSTRYNFVTSAGDIYPVVYLSTDAIIRSGSGSSTDPYEVK